MPWHESIEMKVRVIVEVDGHTFVFDEHARRVAGARYHGDDPKRTGYSTSDTLESSIRGAADTLVARAQKRVNETLRRLYPVAGDESNPANVTSSASSEDPRER